MSTTTVTVESLEGPSPADFQDALSEAQARITELKHENERLRGQRRPLALNTLDEPQQPESPQNTHAKAEPEDGNDPWEIMIHMIRSIKKGLEEHNCTDAHINEGIYTLFNYELNEISKFKQHTEVQDKKKEVDLKDLTEHSVPSELPERTIIHDWEAKFRAQDMTLRARKATIREQSQRIDELNHEIKQMKDRVYDALFLK